jgi:hypothetical protein
MDFFDTLLPKLEPGWETCQEGCVLASFPQNISKYLLTIFEALSIFDSRGIHEESTSIIVAHSSARFVRRGPELVQRLSRPGCGQGQEREQTGPP